MKIIEENITFEVLNRSSVEDTMELKSVLTKLNKSSEMMILKEVKIDVFGRFSREDSDLCKSIAVVALSSHNGIPVAVAFASYYGISKVVDYQIIRSLPDYVGLGIIKELHKELNDELDKAIGDAKVKGRIYRGIYKNTLEKDRTNEESYNNSKFSKLRVIISEDKKVRLEINPEKKIVNTVFKNSNEFTASFFVEQDCESDIDEFLILGFLSDLVTFDCVTDPYEKEVMCGLFTAVEKSIEF